MAGYTDANGNEYDDNGKLVKSAEGTSTKTSNPGVSIVDNTSDILTAQQKAADDKAKADNPAYQGYAQDMALKKAAVGASKNTADIYSQIAAAKQGQALQIGQGYDAQTKAGGNDLRAAGAQALAAAQSGGGEGAANYGAMLQGAADTGRGIASFDASQGVAKTAAVQNAQNAALEAQAQAGSAQQAAAKEAFAAGSDEKDRNALRAQVADYVATVIKSHHHSILPDDKQSMYNDLITYKQTIGDPVVQQEIDDQAHRLLNGDYN